MKIELAEIRTAVKAKIIRATRAAQQALERLDEHQVGDLERIYVEAARDIAERIRFHAGPDDNIALQELRSLLTQAEARLSELSRVRDALLQGNLAKAADLGVRPLGTATLGEAAVVSPSAGMQIADEAIAYVRNFVAADGLQLSDRIWRLDRGARDAVVNAIEQAVIQGHGATQAARELLARGIGLPEDINGKRQAASAGAIARATNSALLTGDGSPLDNAMRLFRTEINRVHGHAHHATARRHPDVIGFRYLLSPAHPRPDICDLLAAQNAYGLGAGVYPIDKIDDVWPAHPNTLSFTEVVFRDEVSDADRSGKETTLQALERLAPGVRRGVLGVHKAEAFDQGLLTKGMVRAPWRAVKQRLGTRFKGDLPLKPAAPTPRTASGPPTLDDMLKAGESQANALLSRVMSAPRRMGEVLRDALLSDLRKVRAIDTPARLVNGGAGAKLVETASRLFPDDWTKAADRFGTLSVKRITGRGYHITIPKEAAGRMGRIRGWGVQRLQGGDGFLAVDSLSTAVHEYVHRLQHALPGLDDYFQELHHRRTAGQPLKRLRELTGGVPYPPSEVAREDSYINPYQGKVYAGHAYLGKHGALEVMTMAFEDVLGGNAQRLEAIVAKDREMFNLVIGLLYRYVPTVSP